MLNAINSFYSASEARINLMSSDPLRGALVQLQHTAQLVTAHSDSDSDVPVEMIVADALVIAQQHIESCDVQAIDDVEASLLLDLLLRAAQLSVGHENDRVSESVIKLWKLFSHMATYYPAQLRRERLESFLDCLAKYTENCLHALRDAVEAVFGANATPSQQQQQQKQSEQQELESAIRVAGFFTQRISLILSLTTDEPISGDSEGRAFFLMLRFHGLITYCNVTPRVSGEGSSRSEEESDSASQQSIFESSSWKSVENIRKVLSASKRMDLLAMCSYPAHATAAGWGHSEAVFGTVQVAVTLLSSECQRLDEPQFLQLVLIVINSIALCLNLHPCGMSTAACAADVFLSSMTAAIPAVAHVLGTSTGCDRGSRLLVSGSITLFVCIDSNDCYHDLSVMLLFNRRYWCDLQL